MTVGGTHGEAIALVQIPADGADILDVDAADVVAGTLHAEEAIPKTVRDKIALGARSTRDSGLDCDCHDQISCWFSVSLTRVIAANEDKSCHPHNFTLQNVETPAVGGSRRFNSISSIGAQTACEGLKATADLEDENARWALNPT